MVTSCREACVPRSGAANDMTDHLKITVDLERDQAEALPRFLRRVGRRPIEAALNASHDDMVRFGQASERLRVALGKALGQHQ